ncbi:MAG: PIN domain-containing protein [Candidatus Micrarchaeota archaeon]|nr:PIN domain-containing protein [Candidatus Micrarchaeota archaeon]
MPFADTSYFIALFRSNDEKHERAVNLSKDLNERVLTTQHVFSEFITFISAKDGNNIAYELGRRILKSELVLLSTSNEDIELALEYIRKHPKISGCDAISAAVMQKMAINKILSFDSDFDRMGFERIS